MHQERQTYGQVFWRRVRGLPRDDAGVVMLETVLVFPLQLLITMLIIQFAHMYTASHVVHYAAFQAARSVVVNTSRLNADKNKEQAARIAWTICSVINNRDPRNASLRVPGNNYYYQTQSDAGFSGGDPMTLTFATETPTNTFDTDIEANGIVVAVKVSYWLDLVVPLGGPFVYKAAATFGTRPVRARSDNKRGQVLVEQIARIPKPWPH